MCLPFFNQSAISELLDPRYNIVSSHTTGLPVSSSTDFPPAFIVTSSLDPLLFALFKALCL